MKSLSYAALTVLIITVLFSSITAGFSIATHPSIASYGPTSQAVQVWFDGTPLLTTAYPTNYEFNVAAKTSSDPWITSLHWDFGDGSTLDVPFSGQSEVSDIRDHAYSQPGIYTVSVTAYDNMGNSGSAQVTVNWYIQTPPPPPTPQILITGVASGQGSVSPNCPSPNGCQEQVGSSVTVTATPSSEWLFSSWSTQTGISCSNDPVCTFNMPNNPVTLMATFTTTPPPPPTPQILITGVAAGQGSVNPDCPAPNGCSETPNSQISVQASPSTGWYLAAWAYLGAAVASCSGNSVTNPCTFIMPNSQVSIYATFQVCTPSSPPTLCPIIPGNLQVTVYSAPITANNPLSGATVTMISTPPGQSPQSCVTASSGQCFFQNVLPGPYTVSASASGYQSNSGSGTVPSGETGQITITLSSGGQPPLITGVASGQGSVSPDCPAPNGCSETPNSQISVLATPTPSSGYTFSSWSVTGVSCSGGSTSNPCTFAMPNNPVTVTANFIPTETGTLQVTVYYQLTDTPISGATATMTYTPPDQNALTCTTDSSGQCTFQNVLTGPYTVSASANGYQPNSGSGTVLGGQTTQIIITLSASNTYILTTTVALGQGSTSPNCPSPTGCSYSPGQSVTVTAHPPSGDQFDQWIVTGASCSAGIFISPCTFSMPSKNVELEATWETQPPSTYTVTFAQYGLCCNLVWGVTLIGQSTGVQTEWSNSQGNSFSTITFTGIPAGSYTFQIIPPATYTASASPSSPVNVNGNTNVQVTFTGTVATISNTFSFGFGSPSSGNGQFREPTGIAVDALTLYVRRLGIT